MAYVYPIAEQVAAQIHLQMENQISEELIRHLADYMEELVMGDPELADTVNEGKKSFPKLVRYVLENTAKNAADIVEAMTEEDFKALPALQVRGRKGSMAGVSIPSTTIDEWAKKYLYGGTSEEPENVKRQKQATAKPKKDSRPAGKGKKPVQANDTDNADDVHEQICLFGEDADDDNSAA